MKRAVFVISDLHLGGEPAAEGRPSFQMCSSAGMTRLAEFIRYAAAQRSEQQDVTLVVAGDIVDFLAEKEFAAFTNQDGAAKRKLENVMRHTPEVWESFRAFTASGSRLVLMLGNHDIELSLPGARRLLLESVGAGRIEFIYDNQAYVDGRLIVEHGNRYDSWNVVSHDGLREVRSAISRGEAPPAFDSPAGSLMVVNVMNRIKQKFPFVDLLKPEDASVLPLLAVLDPSSLSEVDKAIKLWRKQSQVRFAPTAVPLDPQNISAVMASRTAVKARPEEEQLIALSKRLYPDQANINALSRIKDFIEIWQLANTPDKEKQLQRLYEALHARARTTWQAFDVNREAEPYATSARTSSERGFDVVVYGHTHLVKRVSLGHDGAVYLNSGTWADLMQVPGAVLDGDEAAGKQALRGFVADLSENRLDNWRQLVPTFARIDFESETVARADVYFFDGSDRVERVPDGPLTRLRK